MLSLKTIRLYGFGEKKLEDFALYKFRYFRFSVFSLALSFSLFSLVFLARETAARKPEILKCGRCREDAVTLEPKWLRWFVWCLRCVLLITL